VEWKRFILRHWAHFGMAAETAHSDHGPGAVLIDITHAPDADIIHEESHPYVTLKNAEVLMPNTDSAVLSMYLHGSDPRAEALFLLADGQEGIGQIWRQRKREDGSPLPDPDLFWSNRERVCPKCGAKFVSVRARGQCPDCGNIFVAGKDDG
jgi:hypothetical protein